MPLTPLPTMERLRQTIAAIRETIEAAESAGRSISESDTEAAVFDQLLPVLGYRLLHDYSKQSSGAVGESPDYTLLPGTVGAWFLEAKKWGARLTAKDESQVVNYANNQGALWAVLSNGGEWRLYRTSLHAPVAEKCFARLDSLWDADAPEWLARLAKGVVANGELEALYRQQMLVRWLQDELARANSSLMRHLLRTARKQIADPNLTREDLLAALKCALVDGRLPAPPSSMPRFEPESMESGEGRQYSLAELMADGSIITHQSPSRVTLGDQPIEPVTWWSDVAVVVVTQLAGEDRLPEIPFAGQTRGRRWFLNWAPSHQDGEVFHRSRTVRTTSGRTVYIEVNRSGKDMVHRLAALLDAVGIDAATCRITLQAHE